VPLAVSIMIDVVGRCFKEELASPEWQEKIKK
jgi:malate dehydrogenase (quinone)